MKFGPFALRVMRRRLAKEDFVHRSDWPEQGKYEMKADIDALGDGVFGHGFDLYYAPKDRPNKGLLVDIHGGAYLAGSRKSNYGFASVFLEKGYDVATLDYEPNNGKRGVDDQVRVLGKQLRYLADHGQEYGVNGKDIFLMGDSAGGHFALLLAEVASDEALQRKMGIDLRGIHIRAVAIFCPAYDFKRLTQSSILSRGGRKYMFGPRFDDPEYLALYSPRTHLAALEVPLFLASCENDFIKQETLDLHDDAEKLGKPMHYDFSTKADAEIAHVYNVIRIRHEESIRLNEAVDRFFQDHAA